MDKDTNATLSEGKTQLYLKQQDKSRRSSQLAQRKPTLEEACSPVRAGCGGKEQEGSETGRQAGNKRRKVMHTKEDNLATGESPPVV